MHVIVIGGGIIGVTSAYYLRQQGHEVTLIERRGGVAQETSFGNAGIIAPGYVTPWASPGMPRKVLSYLFKAEAPVLFRPNANPALWRWLARWFSQCNLASFRINRGRMQRLALYSRDQLHALRDSLSIEYERGQGYLQLFRSERDLAMSGPARAMLDESGVRYELLDPQQVRSREPGLSSATPLAAGLFLPEDESGNCPMFARRLRQIAEQDGVRFAFGHPVERILFDSGRTSGVLVNDRKLSADTVLVAAACDSVALLRQCGIRVPIYPVKGYSATVSLDSGAIGPQHALMDEAYKTAITPFGNRVRVAGTAEIGDSQLTLRDAALRTLIRVASDWFPGAARYNEAQFWVGARPMLPDGPPLLGATSRPGLFLNAGHGSTGWAMACGSAKLVADLISGHEPEISLEGLTLARYH
jgi:D-amino-acid dehydrogenase